jgi:hypothetical protein
MVLANLVDDNIAFCNQKKMDQLLKKSFDESLHCNWHLNRFYFSEISPLIKLSVLKVFSKLAEREVYWKFLFHWPNDDY